MRTFLAIDLPKEVTDALVRLQAMLPAGRAVPPGNLHLTLAFLDDRPEDQLELLHEDLSAQRFAAPDLAFCGLNCFGAPRPALLFAEIAASAALGTLHAGVHRLIRASGITLPRERYRPHVTLARFRKGADPVPLHRFLEQHGRTALPGFTARQMTLYRSTLHADGARHDPLASYPLS